MGRVEGRVAFVTGAARNQGRSHALRLAEEGADIIAVDICEDLETVKPYYPGATDADLAETVRQIEALDRRIVARKVDVRDRNALKEALDDGVSQLGRLDIVVGNAGIYTHAAPLDINENMWQETIDVDLTGAWYTCQVAIPHLVEGGDGGSIVLTSSWGALKGFGNGVHYAAAKTGLVGMMKALSVDLAAHRIRVNTIHPTAVDTTMIQNEALYRLFNPHLEKPTKEDTAEGFMKLNLLPVSWMEPRDVSNAVLFLASDESRYITGVALPVDAGACIK